MKLLSENELIWSDVVANNNMNRKRKASGVNSYEKDLGLNPGEFLNARLQQKEHVKWLDLCCGEGNALIQYAGELFNKGLQHRVTLHGIDLVDAFQPIPAGINCLKFEIQSLSGWQPSGQYDLITCVHGVHYIGDKIAIIIKALQALTNDGTFLANLDLNNIKIEGYKIKTLFKEMGVAYNARTKILKGGLIRDFPLRLSYQGADDKAGPNYTGQNAVDSFYRAIN